MLVRKCYGREDERTRQRRRDGCEIKKGEEKGEWEEVEQILPS